MEKNQLARSPQQVAHYIDLARRSMRDYFVGLGFTEINTPPLTPTPAPELYINPPPVKLKHSQWLHYFQSSPELAMKRVLAETRLDKIYQLAWVCRDELMSPIHQQQFQMLEWYRKDADWRALLTDITNLIIALQNGLDGFTKKKSRAYVIAEISVHQAWLDCLGFSPLDYLQTPALAHRLNSQGIKTNPSDNWDDLYHRAFLNHVEPMLIKKYRAFFLTGFPAPLCSLAQLDKKDPRQAERFELYIDGIEIANGFSELVDADEQRRRFEATNSLRKKMGDEVFPLDECFLKSLKGLPPSAGIALGWERLLMVLYYQQDRQDTHYEQSKKTIASFRFP